MAEIKAKPFTPCEIEVLRFTEVDLRAVFAHSCDQPDCPICAAAYRHSKASGYFFREGAD